MKTQHTKGPWKTNENAAGNIWIQANGGFIAEITPAYGAVPESLQIERHANARLIAAAPSLLAALETLAQECQFSRKYIVLSEVEGMAAYDATAKAINEARVAIAQAKGEQP